MARFVIKDVDESGVRWYWKAKTKTWVHLISLASKYESNILSLDIVLARNSSQANNPKVIRLRAKKKIVKPTEPITTIFNNQLFSQEISAILFGDKVGVNRENIKEEIRHLIACAKRLESVENKFRTVGNIFKEFVK